MIRLSLADLSQSVQQKFETYLPSHLNSFHRTLDIIKQILTFLYNCAFIILEYSELRPVVSGMDFYTPTPPNNADFYTPTPCNTNFGRAECTSGNDSLNAPEAIIFGNHPAAIILGKRWIMLRKIRGLKLVLLAPSKIISTVNNS